MKKAIVILVAIALTMIGLGGNNMDFLTLGAAMAYAKDAAKPSAEDITTAVDAWLDDHPEATTTVQDGSITKAKLDDSLKNTVDDVDSIKNEVFNNTVITNLPSTNLSTWAGMGKGLVINDIAIQNLSGNVIIDYYSASGNNTEEIWFILYEFSNNIFKVVAKASAQTKVISGVYRINTGWELDKTKTYYVGEWNLNGNRVKQDTGSSATIPVYFKYTAYDSDNDITIGSEIATSGLNKVTDRTIFYNITVSSSVIDEIPVIEELIDNVSDSVGNVNDLTNPADNLVDAINAVNGDAIKITNFSMETASVWAGQEKALFILNMPIIGKSGKVSLTFYNSSTHSSWAEAPFWFILYERTTPSLINVVDKISVNTPSSIGAFNVDTDWTITDDKIYYIGVWRLGSGYLPYVNGGIGTFYKTGIYNSDNDIAINSTTDILDMGMASNSMLLNITVNPDGKHEERHIAKRRLVHFGVDDCVFWDDLITNADTYSSCFDNVKLKYWKKLHDVYGVCVTLNCFCTNGANSIADVPSKWANEFAENADWLKFAFHAEDSETYYDTDKIDAITLSYNTFVTAILKMTGTADAIDSVTRLGFYSGSLENVKAIRDADCGITGLLTADDTRNSYYLNTSQNNYILGHNMLFDAENQILLIHTMPRLESVNDDATALEGYLGKEWQNQNGVLEFFTHESLMTDARVSEIEIYCIWSLLIGAEFGFASNWMPGLC